MEMDGRLPFPSLSPSADEIMSLGERGRQEHSEQGMVSKGFDGMENKPKKDNGTKQKLEMREAGNEVLSVRGLLQQFVRG